MAFPAFHQRLFPIQRDCFRTGICADGRQVLMGPWGRSVIAFFFDSAGNLLGEEEHANVQRQPLDVERSDPEIKRWMETLGCRPGTIHVRQFWVARRSVGISDGLDMFEDEPEMNAAELAENAKNRQEWIDSGDFVFNWSIDYHMSADGKVESN